jgi:NhaP-type Na+/H+ or K+/H+ antiporter
MDSAVAATAVVLLGYSLVERRLQHTPVSGAIVFTAAGLLASRVGLWAAALLAAVLAPTDSALGLPVINNPRVPQLIRHALNVEGGLNDGLALPFVTIFLALAAEQEGAVSGSHVVQVLLRALFLAPALEHATWQAVAYALLSLTVIRMLPVAVSLLKAKLAPQTIVYIGWYGPRGLASIVFADLVTTSDLPEQHLIVPVVMLTVGMSVVLHGVTAPSGAEAYGRWYAAAAKRNPSIREAAEAPPMTYRLRVASGPPA